LKRTRVNYLLAAYGGARRDAGLDVLGALECHFDALDRYGSGLAQITVLWPRSEHEVPGYADAIMSYAATRKNVVVLERENVGWCFGGYHDAIRRWGTKFSHYVLMEDDYVFVRPFVGPLLSMMESCGPRVAMVAARRNTKKGPEQHHFVFMPIGIVRSSLMVKICSEWELIKQTRWSMVYFSHAEQPPSLFTQIIARSGYEVADVTEFGWRCKFRTCVMNRRTVDLSDGCGTAGDLFLPYQGMAR